MTAGLLGWIIGIASAIICITLGFLIGRFGG